MNLNETWQELYAAEKVKWSAGMMTDEGHLVVTVADDEVYIYDEFAAFIEDSIRRIPTNVRCPDFEHPATVGCLLSQVRKMSAGESFVSQFVPAIPAEGGQEGRDAYFLIAVVFSDHPAMAQQVKTRRKSAAEAILAAIKSAF